MKQESLVLGDKKIAYCQSKGALPGVIFLGGFQSNMQGTKALALEQYCMERNHSFLRFDYRGHGESSGDFLEWSIGEWLDDAIDVFDHLTKGPQILIGSSMGAWIMLHLALRRKQRIQALIGVASAPDFTQKLMWDIFSEQQKEDLRKNGFVEMPNDYDDQHYRITKKLIDNGKKYLLLDKKIDLECPVRLIHGVKDKDVPWSFSTCLSENITSKDVEVILLENGDHRLSDPLSLDRITETLGQLLI